VTDFWISEAQKEFQDYQDKLIFSFITELSMSDLLDQMRNLPAHTVVILRSDVARRDWALSSFVRISSPSSADLQASPSIVSGNPTWVWAS